MKTHIHLIVERPDGHRSVAEIIATPVTSAMLEAAEDLLHTLTTGERPPPKGLYELCALAFGTTRQDAKKRLLGAAYGKHGSVSASGSQPRRDLRSAVKNPDWSWPPLHNIPPNKKS